MRKPPLQTFNVFYTWPDPPPRRGTARETLSLLGLDLPESCLSSRRPCRKVSEADATGASFGCHEKTSGYICTSLSRSSLATSHDCEHRVYKGNSQNSQMRNVQK